MPIPEVPDEPTAIEGFPVLGDQTDVAAVALGSRSGAVAVAASPLFGPEQLPQLAWSLEGTGVRLLVDPGMAKMSGRTQIRPVDGLPLQLIAEPRLSGIRAFAKTTLDLLVALLALVVLSPLLVIIMLTIVIADGGPILDRREYIGRGGKLFSSWTFRCTPYGSKARQTIPSASAGGLAVLSVATTKVGRVLMRTGLDEVPRLLNCADAPDVHRRSATGGGRRRSAPADAGSAGYHRAVAGTIAARGHRRARLLLHRELVHHR